MNPLDQVKKLRSEQLHTVLPAISTNNQFANVKSLPQNPGLGENNFSSPHCDSYCSESVSVDGPTGKKLKKIEQYNPYGFTPCMVCNEYNQMIGVSFDYLKGQYTLVVFDKDCNILASAPTGKLVPNSFGGGYFYLNQDNNTIVVQSGAIAAYPTQKIPTGKDGVIELEPLWTSDNIVEMVTGSTDGNTLYSCLPVWDTGRQDHYWFLLAGSYDLDKNQLNSDAYIGVAKITHAKGKVTTEIVSSHKMESQWNDNTFAVDESGAYFVTNGFNPQKGICDFGYLNHFGFENGKVVKRWQYSYENCGYLKTGQTNIGSGTTPTLLDGKDDTRMVAFTDNAAPRMNVVVVNRDNGQLISQTPVFMPMRSADEASLIGVENTIVVENNFGHTLDYPHSQYVPNGPGMNRIDVNPSASGDNAELIWEMPTTHFFAMNMLCRGSGIIFAHTADWNDDFAAVKGGMYYISAIDSFDGRTIWKMPLGRGLEYCHEYGGLYFNREGDLYIGTNNYLISIQNA